MRIRQTKTSLAKSMRSILPIQGPTLDGRVVGARQHAVLHGRNLPNNVTMSGDGTDQLLSLPEFKLHGPTNSEINVKNPKDKTRLLRSGILSQVLRNAMPSMMQ